MSSAAPSVSSIPVGRVWLGVILTWLVPGAGHALLGRRGKALLYFSLITFLFVMGMWLGDFRNLNRELFPLHFLGEVFYGGATLALMGLSSSLELTGAATAAMADGQEVGRLFSSLEVGVLYTTVAGLLNVCVMVDVYETAYPQPAAVEDA